MLRRQTSKIRYQPGDRLWLAALSRLIPQHRWSEVFAVTPATLLPGSPRTPHATGNGESAATAPRATAAWSAW